MKQIVVMIAADTEWAAVKKIKKPIKVEVSPYGEWFAVVEQTDEDGYSLVYFHGGWGKISSASSTQYAIDRWSPDLIINLGTCGGFKGYVEQGQLVLIQRAVVYDVIEMMGDCDEGIRYYTTDIDISWLHGELPESIIQTLMVTGDKDLLPEEVEVLHEKYGAVVGDWESGAIAWVAKKNNVRLLIFRGVSDLVGADGGEAYGNYELFRSAAEAIMEKLLSYLPMFLAKIR